MSSDCASPVEPRSGGLTGLLDPYSYAGPNTAYMKHFHDFLVKKKRLAADKWGADVSTVADVFDPLTKWLSDNVCTSKHFSARK